MLFHPQRSVRVRDSNFGVAMVIDTLPVVGDWDVISAPLSSFSFIEQLRICSRLSYRSSGKAESNCARTAKPS